MECAGNPLVTIIIPVYNTEKFVGRAIESVLAQTYENMEVILVNDGSQDKSGEICEEFARKDARVRVVHQNNSGVSVARNEGLAIAKGKYIQFIDSDDEIMVEMTERFVREMEDRDCDVVICGFRNIGQGRTDIDSETRVSETGIFEANDFLLLSYMNSELSPIVWSSCNMMYRSSILTENKIKFDTSYAKGEDGLFTLEYLAKCRRVLLIDQVFYKHYIFDTSERVNAYSQFAPDLYELRFKYFERLYSTIEGKVDEKELEKAMGLFYDKLIAGLVRLVAYSDYYTSNDILKRLSGIVTSPLVIRAGRSYVRIRKGDSYLIPLLMKWKLVKLLYLALKRKRKHYIDKYGKSSIVRSIYVKRPVKS